MANTLPAYIERRIRRKPPANSFVVPGSTPVVSFGNAQTARVATLGLNPSRVEFVEGGRELVGPSRRLATHRSLGTSDLSNAPRQAIAQVLKDCNAYFQGNPYWKWFDKFQPLLAACRASFDNGSACHLDLVQWATDPTWGKLPSGKIRKQLMADDAAFLSEQLANERLRLLLVNGRAVMRQLRRTIVDDFEEDDPIVGHGHVATRLFVGAVGRVRVIAWSTNLQSSFGVTKKLQAELARRVAAMARSR